MTLADYVYMGLFISGLIAIATAWLREINSRGRDEPRVRPRIRKVQFDIETDYRRGR